jgi:hypothetical protein
MDLNEITKQSLVVELLNGIENLQLAGLQGGISINATQDNLHGTIKYDHIYAANGQPIINQTDLQVELVHTKNRF